MLASFLAWLGALLGGPFALAAVDAYKAKLAAGNGADRIAAELAAEQTRLDVERQRIEQAALAAVEGGAGRWMRWAFAAPFVLFNGKAIVWDRMLHLGVTDALSPELLQFETVIVAAYFGHSAVAVLGRALARSR